MSCWDITQCTGTTLNIKRVVYSDKFVIEIANSNEKVHIIFLNSKVKIIEESIYLSFICHSFELIPFGIDTSNSQYLWNLYAISRSIIFAFHTSYKTTNNNTKEILNCTKWRFWNLLLTQDKIKWHQIVFHILSIFLMFYQSAL